MTARANTDPLRLFHPAVREWFVAAFEAPTRPQVLGWPPIARGDSTLILAPTGSGKTLTAFLSCLNQLMFAPVPAKAERCRVLYVSPLKALASDVERNLRAPLAGIAQAAARLGVAYTAPSIAIRTGDTPAAERARFQREPADILITTPESLYLLLTSRARDALRSVHTIIIDEIHALVPTKRGAHLAISVERLAARSVRPPQRIGLSATQRPLEEVARFLGGAERAGATRVATAEATGDIADEFAARGRAVRYRPVTVIDAGTKKALQLTIEVPVEDMARLTTADDIPSGPASVGDTRPSIWASIHPRMLELVRAHRSTLVFVNSRRLAERLAGALNELAGETLVRSHHGSIARAQRTEVEDLLKSGALRALVATSSLELGIDMGAIDLVIQIEAPPSVASGLQRIGRGGHQANATSEGIIFPKFRGDLLACAAVAKAMHEGAVEASRYPRNPLDIVAQQIVAMTAMDTWKADALFDVIRRAAPFAELSRPVFDSVLDMLSGRYPSDEFAGLRARVTWHRGAGTVTAREGALRVAIANGGTIPDRGLFGVYMAGAERSTPAARVGELDEEMVFESHVGETFVLGASSWRIEDITHDRVLVSPAPGQPGKMPFWKGDRAGRPIELGLAIGRLAHDLLRLPPATAVERLTRDHDLDPRAAENLLRYLRDEMAATGAVPDASTIVVERVRDEFGDWRICVLSPRGGRIHAPWAMAATAQIRARTGVDVETLWGDDGFVVRFPDVDAPPDTQLLVPDPDDVQALVVGQLGSSALFAAKFRENAARSLLLPKRRAGMRAPLWQQRKRAADLLAVAARYGSFPILLETYRECLRDFFDMPALVSTLADIRRRTIRVVTVDADTPSPFAASLLFSYVASFLYDGDAPLAERRAQALSIDQAQLRELLGDAEFRELLDAESVEAVARQLQRLEPRWQARSADGIHDLLLGLGDLTDEEVRDRTVSADIAVRTASLIDQRRILSIRIAGEARYIAAEDAARFRDALGVVMPRGLPEALLQPVADPLGDLARRYARTHAPFAAEEFAARYSLGVAVAEDVLTRLALDGQLLEGEFRPGGTGREWTDAGVLRLLRQRSLAKLRREIDPVEPAALGRFAATWHGVSARRRGADALLDVVEQLQGAPLVASILESEILPARIEGYDPGDLDVLMAAGEVVWVGVDALGERDGRVALYLADQLIPLLPPGRSPGALEAPDLGAHEQALLAALRTRGASFFGALHDAAGGGYPDETVHALWNLVWRGPVTNDTFHALRAFTRVHGTRRRHRPRPPDAFRSRRSTPPSGEGRWARLGLEATAAVRAELTRWAAAFTPQLLARHGIVTRETIASETVPGGFASIYPVLKALEDGGRVRRGYFVAGLGAAQFALPAALDLLRSLRESAPAVADGEGPSVSLLAATDPANPYGAALPWPKTPPGTSRGPTRSVGASVILVDGALAAYAARGDRQLFVYLPDSEPPRSRVGRAIARALITRARSGEDAPRGMLIEEIDGAPASAHALAPYLTDVGFAAGALGFRATFPARTGRPS